ncbi:MAG: hypothetical protein ACLUIQ_09200 [Dialister invisus]
MEVQTSSPVRFGAAILPYEAVWKSIWKGKVPSSDSHEMQGTFPMHVYFESGVWDAEKTQEKLKVSAESTAFSGRKGRT